MSDRWVLTALSLVILLAGCSTGRPLPADWPKIGLTLPGRAEVKQISPAFSRYSTDERWAHGEDESYEFWAVCFACPGGILMAQTHMDSELRRNGFRQTTAEEFSHSMLGGVTGSRGITYYWISGDKRTGVTVAELEDLSARSREVYGELCLTVTCSLDSDAQPPPAVPPRGRQIKPFY
jgi:hypothetical protein